MSWTQVFRALYTAAAAVRHIHRHLFYMLDAKHKTKSENTKRVHIVFDMLFVYTHRDTFIDIPYLISKQ